MIGILLITHGTLGESLVQNVCHVLNKRPPLLAQLGVAAQDDLYWVQPVNRLVQRHLEPGLAEIALLDGRIQARELELVLPF